MTKEDYVAAGLSLILPQDTMAEAGRKAMLKDFAQFTKLSGRLDESADAEAVHKMRVASRRIRSVFRLLGDYYKTKPTRPYVAHLKKVAKHLGTVRDFDVMLLNLSDYIANATDFDEETFTQTQGQLQKRRQKALKQLLKFISTKDHKKFVKKFTTFLTTEGKSARNIATDVAVPYQVRHVLPTIVHDHLATIKAYDNVLDDADAGTLHALRIEFKHLRYLITHFQDVLGNSSENFIADVTNIQDYLGHLNDLVIAQAHFSGIVKDTSLNKDEKKAVLQYVDHMANAQTAAVDGFAPIWEKFNTRTVQRRLSDALLVLR